MDLGLYNLKYPFRKMIGFLLPIFRNVDPNTVSWSLIPIGLLTAFAYYFGFYLVGAVLILLRMIVGTLDGLMAEKFNKSSAEGEMINRIAPEVADILLMFGVVFSQPNLLGIGIFALGMCWAVTFFGLIGIVAGRKIQSVGPVGQTDRVVALAIFSVLQLTEWNFDFMYLFLWWVFLGSLVTVSLRAYRNLKKS